MDEQAVADALKNGQLAFYGADAFGTEPLPQESPLRGLPNALLTPHIAWATNEALQRLMDITTNNLRTWMDGAGENLSLIHISCRRAASSTPSSRSTRSPIWVP